MSRSSRARITAARRLAPMPWSAAGVSRVVSALRGSRSPGQGRRATPACAQAGIAVEVGEGAARGGRDQCRLPAARASRAGRSFTSSLRPRSTAASPPPRAKAAGSPARRRAPTASACAPRTMPSWSARARSPADDPELTVPPARPCRALAGRGSCSIPRRGLRRHRSSPRRRSRTAGLARLHARRAGAVARGSAGEAVSRSIEVRGRRRGPGRRRGGGVEASARAA